MRALPILGSLLLLSACSEDVPPMQPAPPADRNFTATVNDQPVVGGTQRFDCQLRQHGNSGASKYLLTFTDDVGHTIQVAIERGNGKPGKRKLLDGMALGTGVAYGPPKESSAELTAVDETSGNAILSGRFGGRFDVASVAPGIESPPPLLVRDAVFEQVPCSDMRDARNRHD
jgi:hypothetical protein